MHRKLLTITVAIYRAEQFLRTCIDSLLAKDVPTDDYEILLIDDGSDDICPEICDSYAAVYSNVRVIHQSNQGLAQTRNIGIKEAHGEYIAFADADDSLDIRSLLLLARSAHVQQLDLLCYGYNLFTDQGELMQQVIAKGPKNIILSGMEFLREQRDFRGYVWRYIYRKELLINEQAPIYFKRDLLYIEDIEWIPRVLAQTNRMMISDMCVYNYYLRTCSITHSYAKRFNDVIDKKFRLIQYYQAELSSYTQDWYRAAIGTNVESILTVTGKFGYSHRKAVFNRLQTICPQPYPTSYMSWKSKIKIMIINISPALYCWLRHIL